ncbi:stalk domain-containing protein [Desulfotruncus alcoholivorax]|uniref:stalk domain-containing protein n=1 Tax=Desulfotruncus alcoholivorax TaxID=265477 RepID=UPI0004202E07|nr:stalk domain-containing protein [Desulfotruncus alcoholivorax]
MIFKRLCTALTLTALLAAPPLWSNGTAACAQDSAKKVILTLGSKDALLNDAPCQLEIPPVLVDGTAFLPARFVAEEILGAAVKWDATTKIMEITKDEVDVKMSLKTGQASVNGQEMEISNPPLIKDGRTLVPLRFLAENLNMSIEFNAADKTIIITEVAEPAPVNLTPVITSLGLPNDVIKIGEALNFNYTYDNEEGEGIAAEEWSYRLPGDTRIMTGKPRAFFQPGEYTISLRIKDAAGNWSETSSTSVTVADEKLMSEMAFKFSKPVYGELFENDENVNFYNIEPNENIAFKRTGPVLHLSNSPEVVTGPGVLYRSDASGNFRLMYHHLNGSPEKQCLYVIAENNSPAPVTLKTLKSGVGGPATDYMNLGQTVTIRYLSSQPSNPVTIQPGQKIILNPGLRPLNYKEAVTGMQDFQADGTITISVIMGPEKAPETEPLPEQAQEEAPAQGGSTISPGNLQEVEPDGATGTASEPVPVKTPEEMLQEKIEYLLSLPVLPRNSQQVRGVFPNGDCLVDIQGNGKREEKITLGMEAPGFDTWAEGVDPLTGETVKNFGNYGVVYHLKMSAPVKTGVLLNPRGSIFKGSFLGPDGKVYKAPATSYCNGLKQAAVLGVLRAGQTDEFVYTPPSGSDTPIVMALIPEAFWNK